MSNNDNVVPLMPGAEPPLTPPLLVAFTLTEEDAKRVVVELVIRAEEHQALAVRLASEVDPTDLKTYFDFKKRATSAAQEALSLAKLVQSIKVQLDG